MDGTKITFDAALQVLISEVKTLNEKLDQFIKSKEEVDKDQETRLRLLEEYKARTEGASAEIDRRLRNSNLIFGVLTGLIIALIGMIQFFQG